MEDASKSDGDGSAPGGRTSGQQSRVGERQCRRRHRVAMPTGRRRPASRARASTRPGPRRRSTGSRWLPPTPTSGSSRTRRRSTGPTGSPTWRRRRRSGTPSWRRRRRSSTTSRSPRARKAPTTPRRPPRRSRASAPRKNKHKAVRILGDLFVPDVDVEDVETAEDQGSIPLATDTGIPAESGRRHDHQRDRRRPARQRRGGRHRRLRLLQGLGLGRRDDRRQHRRQPAGLGGRDLDADGELVAFNDDVDFPFDLTSRLSFEVPADGDYYAMIGGFSFDPLPADPFDSGSGPGAGEEDEYTALITAADARRRPLRRTAEVR